MYSTAEARCPEKSSIYKRYAAADLANDVNTDECLENIDGSENLHTER